jgi:tripartite-type tricarboxylate transporter receptor subunit TctC
MQRGELDGTCALYMSTMRSQFMDQVKAGDLTVWMTFGKQRTKEFPDVPTIYEVVKSDADRQLADLIFGQDTIGRPLTAPPGLSADRAAILRAGFMATMADKALVAEATKMGLSIDPMTGEETLKAFEGFYRLPKAVVERAIKIIGRKAD